MRSSLAGLLVLSIGGLAACSSDSSDEGIGGDPPAGSGGAGTDAGVTVTAGSGGTGGASNSDLDTPPGDISLAGASAGGNGSGGNGSGGNGAGQQPGDAGVVVVPDAGAVVSARDVCPEGPFAASPLVAGAAPQPVCTGMTFTEGAVWFAERNTLYFSDFQMNAATNSDGRILSFTPGGACEVFIQNAGTNGLAIGLDGNLLGARHFDQTLTTFDIETGEPTVFVADNGGLAFQSPNDIVVRSDGNIYFSDANYMLGNRTAEQPTRAYRRDPSGNLTVVDAGTNPNGIQLSPDETRLYVAHLGGGGNNMLAYDLDAAGAVVGAGQPFGTGSSDGMAVDCAGNVYATQQGVRVFSPDGDLIGTLPAQGAANVAFGGPDRRTLFITAGGSLLSIELAIPGLPY
ncbi:MAG: SMP-30/gluconolactonase/LRE family protein [Polyangiaceae bacterium]